MPVTGNFISFGEIEVFSDEELKAMAWVK